MLSKRSFLQEGRWVLLFKVLVPEWKKKQKDMAAPKGLRWRFIIDTERAQEESRVNMSSQLVQAMWWEGKGRERRLGDQKTETKRQKKKKKKLE